MDVAILGGGNAGYACALRAAQLGLSVTLVERDKVGGTCLHRGCIPTKALLHSAEVVDHIRSAGDFGVLVGEPSVDWGKVLGYQTSVVGKLYRGLQGVIKARKVNVAAGSGVLIAPDAIKVTAAEASGSGASITYETSEGTTEVVTAERCLVATGRGPISEGLGYEEQGVRLERGFVVTDEWCRTGVDGLWAVGDLITQPSLGLPIPHLQLAHVAFAEGIHVAEQIAGSADPALVDYLGVPRCTYSTPEIASVGYTEAQAREAGYDVEIARYQWAASGKASILGEPHGFVKAIAEKGGRVLGVKMTGPRATEWVAEAQLIGNWKAYRAEVGAFRHRHPPLSEAVGETMLHLAGKQLHGA